MFKRITLWFNARSSIVQIIMFIFLVFLIRTFFFGLYQVPTGSMETNMLVGERFLADKFTIWFQPIKRGDIIVFNNPEYEYSSNPIISLWQRYVWGPDNWTKRVIALPGDHIKGVIEDGKPAVYLNGKKLDESAYLNKYPLIAVWEQRSRGNESGLCPVYKSFDPENKEQFYRINKNTLVHDSRIQPVRYPQTPLPDGSDIFEYTLADDEVFAMGDNRLFSYDSRGWGPLKIKDIHGKILFRIWSHDSNESWWIVDLIKHPIDFWKRMRWNRFLQVVR